MVTLTRNLYEKDLTSNTLKYIAIIAMFFDHLFAVFILHDSVEGALSRIPGRIVAPIMCYLIAEGYFFTSDAKKYAKRLLIFAAISHFPYVIYFGLPWWKATSVFWSLALGLIALAIYKNEKLPLLVRILLIVLCCAFAIPADWNFVAVLWILFFGIYKGQFNKQIISFIVIGIVFHLVPTIINSGWSHAYQFGIFLALPFLVLYKGRRGKKSKFLKWGFYVFYPAHLLILFIIYKIVF